MMNSINGNSQRQVSIEEVSDEEEDDDGQQYEEEKRVRKTRKNSYSMYHSV